MALNIGEFKPVMVGQIGGGHGLLKKPVSVRGKRVDIPEKQRDARDSRIRELAARGYSTFKIYNILLDDGLIVDKDGRCQSLRTLSVIICHARDEMGIQSRQRFNVTKFQRLKKTGFRKSRIMQIMKITKFSYERGLHQYWYEKTYLPDHEKKIELTMRLRTKIFKMMRLGYTKDKIRDHLQLTNGQYILLRNEFCKKRQKEKLNVD